MTSTPRNNSWVLLFITAASLVLPASNAIAEAKVIEGFENLGAVSVVGGKLTAVSEGDGVTEGKQAALFPKGATITLKVSPKEIAGFRWVKVDTLGVEPVVVALAFDVSGRDVRGRRIGRIAPNKDTVALPLSVLAEGPPRGWGEDDLTLRITNEGPASLVVDNLRLESAAELPDSAVALDFGGGGRSYVWPGFSYGAADDVNLLWGDRDPHHSASLPYPDPLTGDFVGKSLGVDRRDTLVVAGLKGRDSVIWAWFTHYGPGFTQPLEYGVNFNGQTVAHKRLGPVGALGPEGLLEGKGGEWTPEWFDAVYAKHFVDTVRLDARGGRAQLELLNCQIAAMVICQAADTEATRAFVDQVEKDISRFRRQFVVGQRFEAICEVAATQKETDAGVMVFQSPEASGFSPWWTPAEADRAETVRMKAITGGRTITAVAVVPLDDLPFMNATMGICRGEDGRLLTLMPNDTQVFFLDSVPRVVEAQAVMHPFLPVRSKGPTASRTIAFMVISARPREGTPPGRYTGSIRLNFRGGPADIPLEIAVSDLGALPQRGPVMGAVTSASVGGFTQSHAYAQNDATNLAARMKLRQALMAAGLEGLLLQGPDLNWELRLDTKRIRDDLGAYPAREATGVTLLDIAGLRGHLGNRGRRPGQADFRRSIDTVVKAANGLLNRTLSGDACFYVGRSWNANDLGEDSRYAEEVKAVGGKPIGWIEPQALIDARESRNRYMNAYAAIVLTPRSKDVSDLVHAFKRLDGERRLFLSAYRADRFLMGFYARAVGADGCYLDDVFISNGGPYTGFWVDGDAVVVPQEGGMPAETTSGVRIRQAVDDYILMQVAEGLVEKAAKAKIPAEGLEALLKKIRETGLAQNGINIDGKLMRSLQVDLSMLDEWRGGLIDAAAEVADKLREADQRP